MAKEFSIRKGERVRYEHTRYNIWGNPLETIEQDTPENFADYCDGIEWAAAA